MAILSPTLRQRFFSASGLPLSGGKVYTYAAGTTTPLASYDDATESSANANPVILDANGECDLWLGGNAYKITLTDSADVAQWTVDNVNQASENTASSPDLLENFGLTSSVGSNALTINLTNAAGSAPSALSPIAVGFRSNTLSSGLTSVLSVNSPLGISISSGSTLGHASGVQDFIYVYLLNNNGVAEIAVSSSIYSETALYSTVAEGGAGAADSRSAIYSITARTNVPIRIIGRLTVTQATAGTWASAPTQIQVGAIAQLYTNSIRAPTYQIFTTGSGTYTSPSGVRFLRVKMAGGGGGAGAPDVATSAGGAGGTSTFGTSFLTAPGGSGSPGGPGAAGGAGAAVATITAPAVGRAWAGERGQPGGFSGDTNGGHGGSTVLFGGSAPGGYRGLQGGTAVTNSGAGGGGGGGFTALGASSGGGGGASLEAIVLNPSATYSYAVGAAGTPGSTGGSGIAAGVAAAGIIIVEENY